jgi:hypothetical protein
MWIIGRSVTAMQVNVKFLSVTFFLSAISGLVNYALNWVASPFLHTDPAIYSILVMVFGSMTLAFSVFVPLAMMYFMSNKLSPIAAYRPIIVSVFLGCWIGSAIVELANQLITLSGGVFRTSPWMVIAWIIWIVFVVAFSRMFFVCLSMVLFVRYRKTSATLQTNVP